MRLLALNITSINIIATMLATLLNFWPCCVLCDSGKGCKNYAHKFSIVSTELECISLGAYQCNSSDEIAWKFNHKTIYLLGHFIENQTLEISVNQSLIIDQVRISDAGKYSSLCSSVAFRDYHLQVEVAPSFYVSINTTRYNSTGNATFHVKDFSYISVACHADGGTPPVTLTWLVDEEAVDSFRVNFTLSESAVKPNTSDSLSLLLNSGYRGNETITCIRGPQYISTTQEISIQFWINESVTPKSTESTQTHNSKPTSGSNMHSPGELIIVWIIIGLILVILVIMTVVAVMSHSLKKRKKKTSHAIEAYEMCKMEMLPDLQEHVAVVAPDESFLRRESVNLLSRLPGGGKMKYWAAVSSSRDVQKSIFVAKTVSVPYFVYNQYEEGGTLRDFMLRTYHRSHESQLLPILTGKIRGPFEDRKLQLIRFALDVAEGMEYLRKENICHPAVCSRKVLLSRNGTCKLYDFVPEELAQNRLIEVLGKKCPPLAWLPPESIFLRRYSWQADIWSFAVVLWEIFSYGETPYEGLTTEEIEKEIRFDRCLNQPLCCPGGVYSMMLSSWNASYKERPTFSVIVQTLRTAMYSFKQDVNSKNDVKEDPNYFVLEQGKFDNDYDS